MKEIERKFLLKEFPSKLPCLYESIIYQGYLNTNPEIRIRSSDDMLATDYKMCIKGEGDLIRDEIEFHIGKKEYYEMVAFIRKPFIHKTYKEYKLPKGELLQCSLVDEDTENKFYYAEIEFDSEKQAKSFIPLSFLGKEVTNNSEYKMKNYWARTRLGE